MSTLATPAASVADTGAGAGAAPTPSDDLSTSALGTPGTGEAPSGGETAQPDAGAGEGQPEPGSEAQTQGEQASGEDGRTIPAKWRDLFKQDAELRSLFFADRALKKEFPKGLEEIRGMKQVLESAGGEAGIQQLTSDLGEFRTLANQFLDGDPAYVDDIFESDPVAAASHVPRMLEKYQEADYPGYQRTVAKLIAGEHEATGLRNSLKSIYDLIAQNKPQEAQRMLNALAQWHDRISDIAKQEEDPQVKKLRDQIRQDRQTREKETAQTADKQYKAAAWSEVSKEAERIFESFTKGQNLSADDRSMWLDMILKRVDDLIANPKDAEGKAWIQQRDAFLARRDIRGAQGFFVARWKKELAKIVPKIVNLSTRGSKPTPKPAPTGGNGTRVAPTNEGFTRVAAMPNPKDIDRFRTTADMITKHHRAILKDGRKVEWALAG